MSHNPLHKDQIGSDPSPTSISDELSALSLPACPGVTGENEVDERLSTTEINQRVNAVRFLITMRVGGSNASALEELPSVKELATDFGLPESAITDALIGALDQREVELYSKNQTSDIRNQKAAYRATDSEAEIDLLNEAVGGIRLLTEQEWGAIYYSRRMRNELANLCIKKILPQIHSSLCHKTPSARAEDLWSDVLAGFLSVIEEYDPARQPLPHFLRERVPLRVKDQYRLVAGRHAGLLSSQERHLSETGEALSASHSEISELGGLSEKQSQVARARFDLNGRRSYGYGGDQLAFSEREEEMDSNSDPASLTVDQIAPEMELIAKEEFTFLLSRFHPKTRAIMVMYLVEDYTMLEIGEQLELTESQVTKIYNKAISELQKSWLSRLTPFDREVAINSSKRDLTADQLAQIMECPKERIARALSRSQYVLADIGKRQVEEERSEKIESIPVHGISRLLDDFRKTPGCFTRLGAIAPYVDLQSFWLELFNPRNLFAIRLLNQSYSQGSYATPAELGPMAWCQFITYLRILHPDCEKMTPIRSVARFLGYEDPTETVYRKMLIELGVFD